MNLTQIAQLIPDEYRREILTTDMINKAQALTSDASMHYLATVWKNYVSPGEDLACNLCMERILNNYRQLQQIFIDLEKNKQLLQSI